MRGRSVTKLSRGEDLHPRCDCGWLRPKFTEIREEKEAMPMRLKIFFLVFDCPECGARWEAKYGRTS